MNISNLFKIAWKAILLNKTRTMLTMLGIIIGVASVIAMLAIGEGSKESIKKNISSMGANMITIRPGAGMMGGVRTSDQTSMQSLKLSDYAAIKEQSVLIKNVSPLVNGSGQVISGAYNWPTSIYGASPEYLSIREWNVESGVIFDQSDVNSYAKVAVIGKTIQENLFPNGEDPIGKSIRFNSIPFKIIGVLTEKGENTFGQDQDDIIIAPYTTIQKRILAQNYLQSIVASALSEDQAERAVNEITAILEKTHNIDPSEDNDFNVSSQQEIINTFSSTSEMLTVLLVAIAGISLLVGGIGIMNIMYVSVKERTKEIGLRMAIGAKGKFILMQFLIESVLISVTGGLLGVLLGLITTFIISTFLGWPVSITSFSIILSFIVCTITGVFFGWYPARKASASDPITALRYE
ncbi:putative ABC transport system permease protein [Paenimyroides aquimaris]|uniref:Putative ABC transport system permease protein n=1 Tax=Paenimyroides marinum TaxID=1159016 RepID=A0A1H6MGB6_9FLAO|nr:ABC transporter permease [Paenimyroides aquimaris]SEH97347.1 putative ABC transport system permease protein [Paenimyroides aquimaris]